jgi:hypothetical protein
MPVAGAVIAVGGSLLAAHMQSSAASSAADAQTQASQAAIAEQAREYNQSRSDQLPWLTSGKGALNRLNNLNNGNYSSFHKSPDYQFGLNELIKNDDRSAAAHGRLYSGGYGQDFAKDIIGYANQGYGTYYNRIAAMAGVGQTAAQNLGSLGANYANQVGQQYNNIGDARASGYATQANINTGLINGIGTAAANYFSQKPPSYNAYTAPINYDSTNNGTNSNIPAGWWG